MVRLGTVRSDVVRFGKAGYGVVGLGGNSP